MHIIYILCVTASNLQRPSWVIDTDQHAPTYSQSVSWWNVCQPLLSVMLLVVISLIYDVNSLPFTSRSPLQRGLESTASHPRGGEVYPFHQVLMQHSLKNKITSSVWPAFLLLFHLLILGAEFHHFLHRLSRQRPTRKSPLEISLWNSHCSNIPHYLLKHSQLPEKGLF